MTSTILRNELSMGDILIRLELYDIFGYRDFVMFTIDFTKPSPLTDLNVGFQNSDVRVYVNTQYLSIHSAKFAHLFVRIKPGCAERLCPTTENKSEFGTCSNYDVLSMQSDGAEVKLYSGEEIFGARTHDAAARIPMIKFVDARLPRPDFSRVTSTSVSATSASPGQSSNNDLLSGFRFIISLSTAYRLSFRTG
ncbi:hypothetical protein RB195_009744 [Necator americanus]|uniref:Uncharacterized protein n=1 Tax=Necator americanus TaxID=51031 RepID=A0ABR1CWJ8_NECAM